MKLYRQIPFNHEGKDYQIKLLYQDNFVNAAAFLNHHPANGFRHQIQLPKNCDVEVFLDKFRVDYLVELCKKDISENRWDTIAEMMRTS